MQLTLELSFGEVADRQRLEGIIAQGLKSFVDVGNALQEIRDRKLYRGTHGTFEDYCREQWGMSRVHAFRMIEAAQVTNDLLPAGNIVPQTERHARPLVALQPERRAQAWQEAVDSAPNGKVTGEHVERVVSQYRRAERVERINEIAANNRPLDLPQRFAVIYADPPWSYDNSGFDQSAANIYPTMALDDICALPVVNVCTPDAALFLWATSPLLPDALTVMQSWGFSYKASMVWVKDRAPGMGWWVRTYHELLLIGVRGQMVMPQHKPESVIRGAVEAHSKKPAIVYDIIDDMFEFPKLELFARTPSRAGWTSWGNQSDV